MPPTGAFGGNTGIHDAQNLSWKLAAVLKGAAGRALLETYDTERRPVAQQTLAQALARLQAWFKNQAKPLPPPEKIVDDYDVVFGQCYENGALIPEKKETPAQAFVPAGKLSGRPGTRAPHFPIVDDDPERSSLDLFGDDFVLLSNAAGAAWGDAIAHLRETGNVPIVSHCLGTDGEAKPRSESWHTMYGINRDGAVLVRPDGVVAWRSYDLSADPESTLSNVFGHLHLIFRNQTANIQ
jgi:hypothetical protein